MTEALAKITELAALAEHQRLRIEALEAFAEEVATAKPDIYSGRAQNPEDDMPDMMDADYFADFQADARKLLGVPA